MLVLRRKVGEQICVPQFDILLTVLAIQGRKVRLGLAAPEKISVLRKELQDRSPQHSARAVALGDRLRIRVDWLWSAMVNLSLFAWALHSGRSLEEATAMTFVSLVLIQFFKAYNFRSDRHSVLNRLFANKWLNIAIFWEVLLLVVVVYVPFLHAPFDTFSLTLMDWVIVMALALTISPVLEFAKSGERRGWFGELDSCANSRGEKP